MGSSDARELTPEQRAELLKRTWALLSEKDYRGIRDLLSPLPEAELLREPELGVLYAAALLRLDPPGKSLPLIRRLTDPCRERAAVSLINRREQIEGVLLWRLGRLEESTKLFVNLLQRATGSKDVYFRGIANINLGVLSTVRAYHLDALTYFSRAAVDLNAPILKRESGVLHHNIAMVLKEIDIIDQALNHFEYAYEVFTVYGSEDDRLGVGVEKAALLSKAGDLKLAATTAERTYNRIRAIGNRRMEGEVRRVLGLIATAGQQDREAASHFHAAIDIGIETENLLLQAEAQEELAGLAMRVADEEQLQWRIEEAAAIYEKMGAPERARRARARVTPAGV